MSNRDKIVRFSKEEYQKLLEVHKRFYPDYWKCVPLADTVMTLLKVIENLVQIMEEDLTALSSSKK